MKKREKIIGYWSTNGYEFTESKALFNKDLFYGLALDECNQYEFTKDRVTRWLNQLDLDTVHVDGEIRIE